MLYEVITDGLADQRRALGEYAPAADRIVADFRIAHVGIVGQSDRLAVRLELGVDRRVVAQPA